jgi:hypothetical protein
MPRGRNPRLVPKAVVGFGQLTDAELPSDQAAGAPVTAALPAGSSSAQTDHGAAGLAGEQALASPGEPTGPRHYKLRTSDMVPVKVKALVAREQKRGVEASTVVVLAFSRAVKDGQIPRLVNAYLRRGQHESPFGPHVRARQNRGTTTTRLQYNIWDYEDEGIKKLVAQHGVSRAVLVSLVLSYYYDLGPDIV